MFNKQKSSLIGFIIAIIMFVLVGNIDVYAAPAPAPVKKISFYEEQLRADVEKIKLSNDEDVLYSEILELQGKQRRLIDSNVVVTKKGVKVIDPSISDNASLMQAKVGNRWRRIMELRKREKAVYNTNNYFMHIYARSGTINNRVELKDQQVIQEIIVKTLDDLEINSEVFKDLEILISGYTINELLGAATLRSTGNYSEGIIMAISPKRAKETNESYENRVKRTLIHELGHIFEGRIDTEKNNPFGEKKVMDLMAEIYPESIVKAKDDSWANSLQENFAEDFKIYFSKRLGESSFNPGQKNTNYEYNDEVEKIFELYHTKKE